MSKVKPENTVRFAWWGAEEEGLIGSTAYVEGLSQAERDRIALYMNYDMIGSPNYIFMVYDADQSTFEAPVAVPPGSTAIEDLFESYYTRIGEPYDDTEFSGRSDYQAFIEAGIPSGGLFTGAEEVKTEEQAAIWGGTAGEQFDPCYHQACDAIDNVDLHALEVNSDLIAFAMLTYAFSTESVNGVPGKRVPGPAFTLPAPAGPEGTFATEDGGAGPGPVGTWRRPGSWRGRPGGRPRDPRGPWPLMRTRRRGSCYGEGRSASAGPEAPAGRVFVRAAAAEPLPGFDVAEREGGFECVPLSGLVEVEHRVDEPAPRRRPDGARPPCAGTHGSPSGRRSSPDPRQPRRSVVHEPEVPTVLFGVHRGPPGYGGAALAPRCSGSYPALAAAVAGKPVGQDHLRHRTDDSSTPVDRLTAGPPRVGGGSRPGAGRLLWTSGCAREMTSARPVAVGPRGCLRPVRGR